MSLQIWLPFNGSLVNQGVYNSTITSTSPQYSTSGKIGKALSLASNGNYTVKTTYTQNNNEMSICFWVNPNNPGIWTDIFSFGGNNRMEVSSDDKKSYTWYVDSGKQGLISSGTYLFGLELSTWSHVAIAIDTSSVYFYINGTLTKTVSRLSTTLTNIFAENAFFYVGARVGNSSCYAGLVNDFRVYDECLSPKQVKEISKGLVCHYPLDNNGSGMPNLVNGSNTNSVDTNGFGYSEQTGGSTRTIEYDGGIPCVKITRNSTAHSGWDYFWYNKLQVSNLKINTTYTISFDAIGSGSGTIGLSGFLQGNGTNSLTQSVTTVSNSFNSNGWSHIHFIPTTKASFDDISVSGQVVYMSCSFLRTVNTWIKLKNIRVTEGSNESPWLPSVSDASYSIFNINSNKEIDISGYGHHGTVVSSLPALVSNSARYSCVYNFVGSTNNAFINTTTDLNFTDNFSWACWVKTNYTGTTAQYIFTIGRADAGGYGYGIQCTSTTNCNIRFGNKSYGVTVTGGQWTHLAFTKSGTTIKTYKNGSVVTTATFDGTLPTYSDGAGIGIGCFHYASGNIYPYYGNISDFRIYATALSADDIKELYQTSASIDNKGNILGYDIQE